MAVNCSERKKPPTTRIIMISKSGVDAVNSADAARNTELTIALTTMILRKPKVRMMRAASVFMPIAPTAEAEAKQKPADDAGTQRRQVQQGKIQYRRSGSPGMDHIERHRNRTDRHQRDDGGPRQQIEAGDRKPERKAAKAYSREHEAIEIEPFGGLAADRVDVAQRHEDAEQADRDVD